MSERLIGSSPGTPAVVSAVRDSARALAGGPADYAGLLGLIGNARFALLGEASHGTHEFYRERAEITKRLILEKQFSAVAVEADWPDAYRINRYVRGLSDDTDARSALSGFKRFPAWMWRNTVMTDFVAWLRDHNDALGPAQKVGFYGIDLYSLFTSIGEVLAYLDRTDPEAGKRARYRYSCFDHFGENSQAYGYAAAFGVDRSCEDGVVRQLVELTRQAGRHSEESPEADEYFHARQNARLVKNAEEYYRTMFRGRVSSWNLRDRHMVETLQALDDHLALRGKPPRIAVWAHNSHLGDASATDMGEKGEWNVGQLVREIHGREAFLVGFSTYHGTVTAASDWGGAAERKRVRPGLPGSYEDIFHEVGMRRFVLPLRDSAVLAKAFAPPRLQRAIGVIYLPETERMSHYFNARLAQQFDAMIHFDETRALEPLERDSAWVTEEAPETYPSGM
jgi:erythromycin esterase-like protein